MNHALVVDRVGVIGWSFVARVSPGTPLAAVSSNVSAAMAGARGQAS